MWPQWLAPCVVLLGACLPARPPTPVEARLSPAAPVEPPSIQLRKPRPGRTLLLPRPWVLVGPGGTRSALAVADGDPAPPWRWRVGGTEVQALGDAEGRLELAAEMRGQIELVGQAGSLVEDAVHAGLIEEVRPTGTPVEEAVPFDAERCASHRWPAAVAGGFLGCEAEGRLDLWVRGAERREVGPFLRPGAEPLWLLAAWTTVVPGTEAGALGAYRETIRWTPLDSGRAPSPWLPFARAPVTDGAVAVWVRPDRVELGPLTGATRSVHPIRADPRIGSVAIAAPWTAVIEDGSLWILHRDGRRGRVPSLGGVTWVGSTAEHLGWRDDAGLHVAPWSGGLGWSWPLRPSALDPQAGGRHFCWSEADPGALRDLHCLDVAAGRVWRETGGPEDDTLRSVTDDGWIVARRSAGGPSTLRFRPWPSGAAG